MHAVAQTELILCWIAWASAYVGIKRWPNRSQITVRTANWGIVLQTLSYPLAWTHWRWSRPSPGDYMGMALGPVAVVLAWTAVRHLGKQFRVQAGLYHDHELVRTGPYRLVRHPIYASMLALYLATALTLANWPLGLAGLLLFLLGTEIRVRTEDRLLASRFGAAFQAYRKSVPAYLPLLR